MRLNIFSIMGADTDECTFYMLNIIAGVSLFLLTLPTAVVAIVSYVIAAQYWDQTCSSRLMSLSTWLVVNATLSMAYTVGGLLLLWMYCKLNRKEFTGWFLVATLLIVPVKLVWNIVGAVVLFRDGGSCQTEANTLWSMTLAVLIIQWIIIGFGLISLGLCCFCRKRSHDVEEPTPTRVY